MLSRSCTTHGLAMAVITLTTWLSRSSATAFLVRPFCQRASSFAFVRMSSSEGYSPDELVQMQKDQSRAIPTAIDGKNLEQAHLQHQQVVFDEMADVFARDDATPASIVPVMRYVAYSILKRAKHTVTRLLDIGCGTGALFPFYLQAADDLNVTLDLYGVDLSPKMTALAETRAHRILKKNPKHSITVITDDFVSLMQNDKQHVERYDAVVANACFANFFDTDALLNAMKKSIKNDGALFITHPLGPDFVCKLHQEDPSTVPHVLPSLDELQNTTLRITDWKETDVSGNPIYFVEAEKVPHSTLPQVIRLRGAVDAGYGRGGKKLGFPTANLPESLFSGALENVSTGVYFGWAVIEGRGQAHKAAVNVGYSPTFEGKENREKIVEAHLILEEGDELSDFYNETMRLALSGFLRPEQKFDSFPDLVAAITRDVANAKSALSMEPFASLHCDPFIADQGSEEVEWVGKSGGDETASWEFEDISDAIAASRS